MKRKNIVKQTYEDTQKYQMVTKTFTSIGPTMYLYFFRILGYIFIFIFFDIFFMNPSVKTSIIKLIGIQLVFKNE